MICRLRNYEKYFAKYGDEFTIRTINHYGTDDRSELNRIIDGLGSYILYGFVSPDLRGDVSIWGLGDLDVFSQVVAVE